MKARSFFSAGVLLAVALIFSCSSSDDELPCLACDDNQGGSSAGGDKGNDIGNYRTIKIGTQTWMAENLNYDTTGNKCYGNLPANCVTYGRLYDWATAMALPSSCNSSNCSSQIQSKHKGICPSGWHIPSDAEWTTLTNFVGSTAGTKLKAASGWNSNGNGTDEYGFSALPGGGGLPVSGGFFAFVGDVGYWWSATEDGASSTYYRIMDYGSDYVSRSSYNVNRLGEDKSTLFSVRCVQD